MSRETITWLNRNVLIGDTDKRGKAWHYKADEQGAEPNHYPSAIPVADVERRLFDWEPQLVPVMIPVETTSVGTDENGELTEQSVMTPTVVKGRWAVVPSDDPAHVFYIGTDQYAPHGYSEWLIGNVSTILGDTLHISSAGLLRGRAVAWVEISVPETFKTAGVEFRPNLLATTSLDGTVKTTYKRTVTLTVCDNTWSAAMGERGMTFVAKRHTRYSNTAAELDKARQALELVRKTADDVDKQIQRLTSIDVTDRQFEAIVKDLYPTTEEMTARAKASIEKRQAEITAVYRNDSRVNPWYGTAFGVVQGFNTWEHHNRPVHKGTDRAERNMLGTIKGDLQRADSKVWAAIVKELELPDTVSAEV